MGDRNTLRFRSDLQNVIRKTLCRFPDYIDIHAVGTCADNAAKTCCSELEIHIETLFDLILVIGNRLQFSLRILVKIRIAQPLFISCSVIFHNRILLFVMDCIELGPAFI